MEMVGKRFLRLVALAALSASVGCQSWCQRHYGACAPCTQTYAPPPQQCCPPAPVCCPPPNCCNYSTQAAPPTWNQPRPAAACTCPQ
jgi:hypothetical protein